MSYFVRYIIILALLAASLPMAAQIKKDGIITAVGTSEKIAVITLDACESGAPSYFDTVIVNYIVRNKLPVTIFLGGKFTERNERRVKELSSYPFISFQNHSHNHVQHSERLSNAEFEKDLLLAENVIKRATGKKPKYYRFPGGNYSKEKIAIAERNGYQVVHWTFASGDPDKNVSPARLRSWVTGKTVPGAILIFHINGRGYATGTALPLIVADLAKKGYRFVTLPEALHK